MLPGLFFTWWRFAEIITLIPTVGMLSWFVHGFVKNNTLTPNFVLVLFIVSVLALVWAVATLIAYNFTKHNAHFVAFIEICFVGALIAGVYELRHISNADCSNFATIDSPIYVGLGPFGYLTGSVRYPYDDFSKNCSMLKASFAFGIMNIFFFFFTFVSLSPASSSTTSILTLH
jgi:predicted membrane-bound spermidine synthase